MILIVPVYNHVALLSELEMRMDRILSDLGRVHQIVFIDDYSRDSTLIQIGRLSAAFQKISAYRNSAFKGQLGAIFSGLDRCVHLGEPIAVCDLDCLLESEELGRFLAHYDGTRQIIRGIRAGRPYSPMRRCVTRIVNWMTERLGVKSLQDPGSSLFIARPDIINEVQGRVDRSAHAFLPLLFKNYFRDMMEVEVRFLLHGPSRYNSLRKAFSLCQYFNTLLAVRRGSI